MKVLKHKTIYGLSILSLMFMILFTSCEGELDKEPITDLTESEAFKDPGAYKEFLAKIYGGWAVNGQNNGDADIQGIDGNFSNYIRLYYNVQELTTDQSIIAWADGTIHDLHNQVWTPANEFIRAMYYRIYFQVGMTNQFLRETTDEKLDSRGVDATLRAEIQGFRDEARFMRAMSYWHAIDMFGNVPFVTEDDIVGNFFPEQISRADLFNFVETELLDIESRMMAPRQNELGRADQAAVWMLLAKLYLNAEVYTGSGKYTEAMTYINKIIGAGYNLAPEYQQLSLADNDMNGAQNETIFSIRFDGNNTKGFGGTSYLVHAAVGGSMNAADFGINGGWAGIRTTSAFVSKFSDISGNTDSRAMFHTDGQTLEIDNPFTFTEGYAITKNKNLDVNGNPGVDPSGDYVDNDFIVFRLADVYLMYAEAHLRGGGGDLATAVDYVNMIRARAYGNGSGDITAGELNLSFVLDERSRELYWECHRRTDLIRFGQFSDQGVWPWKGGVKDGKTTESFRDLFPIPSDDIIANPNLTQNPGY